MDNTRARFYTVTVDSLSTRRIVEPHSCPQRVCLRPALDVIWANDISIGDQSMQVIMDGCWLRNEGYWITFFLAAQQGLYALAEPGLTNTAAITSAPIHTARTSTPASKGACSLQPKTEFHTFMMDWTTPRMVVAPQNYVQVVDLSTTAVVGGGLAAFGSSGMVTTADGAAPLLFNLEPGVALYGLVDPGSVATCPIIVSAAYVTGD